MSKGTCSVDDCKNTVYCRKMCTTHYGRWRRAGGAGKGPCEADGCDGAAISNNLCDKHYQRLRKYGDANYEVDARRATTITDLPNGHRVCTDCKEAKPLSEYHKDKRGLRGHRGICKPCRGSYMLGYYQENRDDTLARMKQYREDNVDEHRAKDVVRYYRDREKRIALVIDATHRRRALMRENGWERGVSRPALRKIHGDDCPYCGITMSFEVFSGYDPARATVEHILPLSRGGSHTFDNTCLCCWQCNIRKNAKTLDEWEAATLGD